MRKQSNPFLLVGIVLAVAAVFTTNVLLTATAGATFALIWWGGLKSPIRTVMACMLSVQWLQASSKLLLANAFGVSYAEPSTTWIGATAPLNIGQYTATATYLALASIACVSLGARLFLPTTALQRKDFAHFDPTRLLLLYIPLLVIAEVAGPFFGGPLAQIIHAFGLMRFVPLVLLVGVFLLTRRGGLILSSAVLLEVLLGFLSFFSDWKAVLIVISVATLSLTGYEWRRHLPLLTSGLVCLVALGTVWTAIKPAYREALNEGTGQQAILLSPAEQTAALSREISTVDASALTTGVLDLLDRLSYVDHLATVLERVPREIEFQRGGLWGEALQQFLTPRFLFPNKPPLPSDSERTMYFTGVDLASTSQGTSISIGYVGESYIDFGVSGALAISFLIGMTFALGVAVLARIPPSSRALIIASSIPLLWTAQQFEISNVKLVAIAWTWIASLLFVLSWRWIEPMLQLRRPVVLPRHAAEARGGARSGKSAS